MTIEEATKEYQYDVGIFFGDLGDGPLWYWDINGGYSSVGARYGKETVQEAYEELINFLKTFKPFEK